MKRYCRFAAVAAVLGLLCHSAEAAPRGARPGDDAKLFASGIAAGVAGTATYFALRDWKWKNPRNAKISDGGALVAGTFVCAALAPIISTVVLQRELTLREAHAMAWDCVIPFVGSWLVNRAFDAHPEWEAPPPRKVRRR